MSNQELDSQKKLNQMKWRMANTIWKKSFEENIESICFMFKVKVIEGWEVSDVYEDFETMIYESVAEMEGYKPEEELKKNNFTVLVIKDAIKQIIELGEKELGDKEHALDKLIEKVFNTSIEMVELREQEGFFKKVLRKIVTSFRMFMYRVFQ